MSEPARPAPVVLPFEPVSEIVMPCETVTIIIDRPKGVLDIFADEEVDNIDWGLTCGVLERMGLLGQLGEPEYLKGVDVFRIQLRRPRAALRRPKFGYRSVGALGAAVACMAFLLPAASHPPRGPEAALSVTHPRGRRLVVPKGKALPLDIGHDDPDDISA